MTPTDFTPMTALLGGAMIGAVAVGMMALTGRIAGCSGFLSQLLPPGRDGTFWSRLAFVLGLVLAPMVLAFVADVPAPAVDASRLTLVLGGLLVGFGSVWGGGCTSGHGVCGLSRLSMRSVVATAVFMLVAIGVVFLVRHAGASL